MTKRYTKEQVQKAYEKLPEELQEALFSIETTDAVANASTRQNISSLNHTKITEYVGYVLLGLILPQDFEGLLQEEIGMSKKIVKEVAREINRFVFYPVKPALEQLHQVEIKATSRVVTSEPEEEQEQKSPQQPSGPDIYQESLEE